MPIVDRREFGGRFTVKENSQRLANYRYLEIQLMEMIGGWSHTTPQLAFKATFGYHVYDHAQAADLLSERLEQLRAARCNVRTDAAGNLHARPAALGWNVPAFLSGSHLDSVLTGGKFDDVVGVACPLEILRAAHDAEVTLPLELIVFAEEEGTTFSQYVLGQRLMRAHRILTDPRFVDRSITSVAFDVGFGDLSYFNRAFRRCYGGTPSEVRAEAQEARAAVRPSQTRPQA